jgi:mono/diheme cytochrome c family protein
MMNRAKSLSWLILAWAALACGGEKEKTVGTLPGAPPATDEELNVPVSENPESPFASPVMRAGLLAWRKPHDKGACVACHTADAYDLAFFNYDDGTIIRRGLGQGATVDEMHAIVAMVHYLRERDGITPVDPTKYIFLQPGGVVLEGETMAHRDLKFYMQLRELGLRIFQEERITTLEEAQLAVRELLALDLRKIKIGLPMNAWTSDQIRGEEFRTIQKWIPEIPRQAKTEHRAEWHGLQNAYIANPSPETLWAFLDRSAELTDDLGIFSRFVGDGEGEPTYVETGYESKLGLYHNHYRAVQIAGLMMRNRDTVFPDFHPVDPNNPESDFDFGESLARDRVDSFWGSGAPERTSRHGDFVAVVGQDFLRKVTLIPDSKDVKGRHSFESIANQVTWMWQGMVYDAALQFSAGPNRAEYFFEQSGKLQGQHEEQRIGREAPGADLSFHRAFISIHMWAHSSYGWDTRYVFRGAGRSSTNSHPFGASTGGAQCPAASDEGFWSPDGNPYDYPTNKPAGYDDAYRAFMSNMMRVRVLMMQEFINRTGYTEDCAERLAQINEWLAHYETPENYATIGQVVTDTLVAMGAANPDLRSWRTTVDTPEVRAQNLHLQSTRYESLPIDELIPSAAFEPPAPGPVSEMYALKCAGCHGTDGSGRPSGGEEGGPYPPLQGVTRDAFMSAVRNGKTKDGAVVPMPSFNAQQLSDAELEIIWSHFGG